MVGHIPKVLASTQQGTAIVRHFLTKAENLDRAAVTLDLQQVGVINAFSRQTGRITYSLYDDQKTHIFNITTVFFDLNLSYCLLTLILILAFGIYYFQLHFHTIYFKVVSIITP